MFEPNTFFEKRIVLLEGLVMQMLNSLPQESLQYVQQPFQQFMQSTMRLKADHVNDTMGPVEIPAEERPTNVWIMEQLANNLGRTVFAGKMKGTDLEGAIGTKSFGQKYLPWLKSLPTLDASWAADMKTGFYGDDAHSRVNPAIPPVLSLVINTPSQLIVLSIVEKQFYGVQAYKSMVPSTLDYQFIREEFSAFRADITKSDFLLGLVEALVGQERERVLVDHTLAEVVSTAYPDLDVIAARTGEEATADTTAEEQKAARDELADELAADFEAERQMIESLAAAALPEAAVDSEAAAAAQLTDMMQTIVEATTPAAPTSEQ